MRILALEREVAGTDPEAFGRLLRDEALRVWELHQEGVIREIHFRDDRPDAVLLLECPDLDMAERALSSLPLVKAGLISFEVIPLRPYSGFERLFVERAD